MDWTMRRKERAMSLKESEKFLQKAMVGRLGTSLKNEPYVVPLNFVYFGGKIYFHCAKEGRKMDALTKNPKVCFEVDQFVGTKEAGRPCSFSAYYKSVVAYGKARIIETTGEKAQVLGKLLKKYAMKKVNLVFDRKKLERVSVVGISVQRITGKQNLPTAK